MPLSDEEPRDVAGHLGASRWHTSIDTAGFILLIVKIFGDLVQLRSLTEVVCSVIVAGNRSIAFEIKSA
jgi:hypothetical protein